MVDFYCAETKLIVEVDGSAHEGRQEQDAAREFSTCLRGCRVLRIQASQVETDLPGVLAAIIREVERCMKAPET